MDSNKLASELVKIAKQLSANNKSTPVSEYLSENWNKFHDLFYDLEKAASEYDIADYGDKASEEAAEIYKTALEVSKNITKTYNDSFKKLAKMEEAFIDKNGTLEEYLDKVKK